MQSVPFHAAERPLELLSNGTRLDGRSLEEFRRGIFLSTRSVSQASGSSYVEFDNTKVIVAIYGPREGGHSEGLYEQGRLQCDVSFAAFASRQRKQTGDRAKMSKQNAYEKELASQLCTALTPAVQLASFPKSVVDVCCVVLESGGSDLAVATCAAALALADAGIEMLDLVAACSVSRVGDQLLLDPTTDEAHREGGNLMLAMMPTANLVTSIMLAGEHTSAQATEGYRLSSYLLQPLA
ncbi:hypothetical protein WJX73_000745 [Symbiochloris irregularis]|uniref:Uncharacterized protein n=1 Tax=Symbiochloris irregularis TaxID=706552 RepID=A0AAW1PDB1_9CHLO